MVLIAVVTAPLLVAGCKGNADKAPAPAAAPAPGATPAAATPPPAAPKSSCSLVSPAEVGAALGIADLKEPEVTPAGSVTLCKYGSGKSQMRVMLRYETGDSVSTMALSRKGFDEHSQPTKDVAGLGEGAFSSGDASMSSLAFLAGTTGVLIVSADPLEKQTALARVIIDKLK